MPPHSLLLVLLAAIALTFATPFQKLTAGEERAAAFKAQRPLHTTALLAGAAVTPAANHEDLKVRDLRTVTGEDGLWVHLDDIGKKAIEDDVEDERDRSPEEDDEELYGRKVKEQIAIINRREGWEGDAGEI